MKKLFFLSGTTLLFAACKDQYKTCPNSAPNIYIYGYDSTQIDTIVISRYIKGTGFLNKLNDSIVVYEQNIHIRKGVDSFWFGLGKWNNYINEYENYDWRYTLLYDGNHVDVMNAVRKYNKTSVNHPELCGSPIVKATIDGQVVEDESGIKAVYLIK